MQKKQQQAVPNGQNIMATILSSIPKEANVTKIDYEGPRIALYTKTPRFLMENNTIISNLVKDIKKRIVIRIDESIGKTRMMSEKFLIKKYRRMQIFKGSILIPLQVKFP